MGRRFALIRALLAARVGVLLFVSFLGSADTAAAAALRDAPVSFSSGNVRISGSLLLPDGTARHPAVVVLHTSGGGTRDFEAYRHLAEQLPRAGIAVLLYDRRGTGQSEGNADTATFQDLASDAVAAVEFLRARQDIDPERVGVWGLSQGGWLSLLAAASSKDIAFVVSISAPGMPPAAQMDYAAERALRGEGRSEQVIRKALAVRAAVNDYYRGRSTREAAERAVREIRGEPWFSSVMLPASGAIPEHPESTRWHRQVDYDPLPALRRVNVPTLLIFAGDDPWVPVEASIAAIAPIVAAKPDMTIRRVGGTGHYMESVGAANLSVTSEAYVSAMLEWLKSVLSKQALKE